MLLASLLSLAAVASEPVLVPDFTPATPDDWVVTNMVQNLVTSRLVSDGHIVIDGAIAARAVDPTQLASCGPSPTCPQNVLPSLPARLAVVVTTGRETGALMGHVELYLVGQNVPAQVGDLPIPPGNEQSFADEVSRATNEMLTRIGPSPDAVLMAAARLIAGQPVQPVPAPLPVPAPVPMPPQPTVVPVPAPVPVTVPVPPKPPAPIVDLDSTGRGTRAQSNRPVPGDQPPHQGPLEPILEGTGVGKRHLVGSEAPFRKSGMDPRDWVFRATPHAGRLTLQVSSGLAMGDVEREGEFLVERDVNGTQVNAFSQEGPNAARRVRGDIFVGYAPATMFDFGLTAGLQYAERTVTTGFVDQLTTGDVDRTIGAPISAAALEFYLQPRLRGYLVPLGPAKPFVFTGAEFRIFDGYKVDQPVGTTFLLPTGGVMPGFLAGGGVLIDPSPIFGLYFEGSYVRYFGDRSLPAVQTTTGSWAYEYSAIQPTAGICVVLSGGVQFRL